MVGDDIEADIGGAKALGMRAVLVRTGKFREDTLAAAEQKPDAVLDSIADLPAWLAEAEDRHRPDRDRPRRALACPLRGFRERVFTEEERAYCDSRPNPAQHYAARFAGKEAVGKALGCGVRFTWREIEIAGRPKPGVRLSGWTKAGPNACERVRSTSR